MSVLLSAHQIRKAFAARPLFDSLTFSIESGERIGLIGPNGAGKSTLLRILAGKDTVDTGTLSMQRGLRVGYLEQVPTFEKGIEIRDAISQGVKDPHDWECIARVEELMAKLDLKDGPVDELSGGWKKRVALARELARDPDLLLLDEPTNHLDVDSIIWLEDLLASQPFATITITHDRAFLMNIATRIIELDRRLGAGMLSHSGDYASYVEVRESVLAAQASRETSLKNVLRRETEWLRRGAKARTTKQQARIKRAENLADEVSELEVRNRSRLATLEFDATERAPKKLIEAKGISKSYGDRLIFPKLNVRLSPGTRLGLMGANGCGKSTLIRALLKREKPDTGEVFHAEALKVAYFEQNRESLDPKLTVMRTVCPIGDFVDYRGGRVHVRSYLDRFLFPQGQMEMAVGKLSGGEQSRILLARLMLQEANVLVLDEPTNDLDFETLNVLADCLLDFSGAVILVTHDRFFMDQVATQLLAFSRHPETEVTEVVPFADLAQWEQWHALREVQREAVEKSGRDKSKAKTSADKAAGKRKLSFKEQRELDEMEPNIHKAEALLAALTTQSAEPSIATNAIELGKITSEMARVQGEINRLYARWEELQG